MSLTAELRVAIREARSKVARRNAKENNGRGHSDIVTPELIIALAQLSPNQREVWIDRNMINRSLESIGKDMKTRKNPDGITRERVRQLEVLANRRLAALLPAEWLEAQRLEYNGSAS